MDLDHVHKRCDLVLGDETKKVRELLASEPVEYWRLVVSDDNDMWCNGSVVLQYHASIYPDTVNRLLRIEIAARLAGNTMIVDSCIYMLARLHNKRDEMMVPMAVNRLFLEAMRLFDRQMPHTFQPTLTIADRIAAAIYIFRGTMETRLTELEAILPSALSIAGHNDENRAIALEAISMVVVAGASNPSNKFTDIPDSPMIDLITIGIILSKLTIPDDSDEFARQWSRHALTMSHPVGPCIYAAVGNTVRFREHFTPFVPQHDPTEWIQHAVECYIGNWRGAALGVRALAPLLAYHDTDLDNARIFIRVNGLFDAAIGDLSEDERNAVIVWMLEAKYVLGNARRLMEPARLADPLTAQTLWRYEIGKSHKTLRDFIRRFILLIDETHDDLLCILSAVVAFPTPEYNYTRENIDGLLLNRAVLFFEADATSLVRQVDAVRFQLASMTFHVDGDQSLALQLDCSMPSIQTHAFLSTAMRLQVEAARPVLPSKKERRRARKKKASIVATAAQLTAPPAAVAADVANDVADDVAVEEPMVAPVVLANFESAWQCASRNGGILDTHPCRKSTAVDDRVVDSKRQQALDSAEDAAIDAALRLSLEDVVDEDPIEAVAPTSTTTDAPVSPECAVCFEDGPPAVLSCGCAKMCARCAHEVVRQTETCPTCRRPGVSVLLDRIHI